MGSLTVRWPVGYLALTSNSSVRNPRFVGGTPNCPDSCEQLGFPCGNCATPETNEGFGVVQETYNGSALSREYGTD